MTGTINQLHECWRNQWILPRRVTDNRFDTFGAWAEIYRSLNCWLGNKHKERSAMVSVAYQGGAVGGVVITGNTFFFLLCGGQQFYLLWGGKHFFYIGAKRANKLSPPRVALELSLRHWMVPVAIRIISHLYLMEYIGILSRRCVPVLLSEFTSNSIYPTFHIIFFMFACL